MDPPNQSASAMSGAFFFSGSCLDIKTSCDYALMMRTTLTLDDDIAVQIQRYQKAKRSGFKAIVNEALRLGLAQMEHKQLSTCNPPTQPRNLGEARLPILSISEALSLAEGEDFR